ncbi:MAG: hypothetical protein LBI29_03265 [Rickettsiales bacterium]|nr:hypothetical protein [Rickettsiales bacterium]
MSREAFSLSVLKEARDEHLLPILVEAYRRSKIFEFLENNSCLRNNGWGAYAELCGSGKLSSIANSKSVRDRDLAEFLYIIDSRNSDSLPISQSDIDKRDSILDEYILCTSEAMRQSYINNLLKAEPEKIPPRIPEASELRTMLDDGGNYSKILGLDKNFIFLSASENISPDMLESSPASELFDCIFIDDTVASGTTGCHRLVAMKVLKDKNSGKTVLHRDPFGGKPSQLFLEYLRYNFSEMPTVINVNNYTMSPGQTFSELEANLSSIAALGNGCTLSKIAAEIAKSGLDKILKGNTRILEIVEPAHHGRKIQKGSNTGISANTRDVANGETNLESMGSAMEEFENIEIDYDSEKGNKSAGRKGRTRRR